jgi:hypothetical protein
MVGPRQELRTWRAWACWALACLIFPEMPADEAQLANEGITEPHPDEIRKHLQQLGLEGEAAVWQDVWYPLSTAAPLSAR